MSTKEGRRGKVGPSVCKCWLKIWYFPNAVKPLVRGKIIPKTPTFLLNVQGEGDHKFAPFITYVIQHWSPKRILN